MKRIAPSRYAKSSLATWGWAISTCLHASVGGALVYYGGAWERDRAKSYGSLETISIEVVSRGSQPQVEQEATTARIALTKAADPVPQRQPIERVSDQPSISRSKAPAPVDAAMPPLPAEARQESEELPEIAAQVAEQNLPRQLASIAAPNVLVVAPEFAGTNKNKSARPLANRPPLYPDPAIRERREGNVTLRLTIAADGAVTNVEILHSSTHSILDASAVRAARSWRFEPASESGVAVESVETQEIRFELR
ncbi:MAG: energy transducer TonB [Planctomycetia bacterium]|nr:energy transducer TonB [Planctomycetia bacterium]